MLRPRLSLLLLPLLAGLLVLSACTSIGLAPAQSLSDKLAYGYGVHTAVLDTIAQESNAGTLSKADGREALKLADDSRSLLDAGRTLLDSDPPGANQKLVLATTVLTQLQTYLRSHSQ